MAIVHEGYGIVSSVCHMGLMMLLQRWVCIWWRIDVVEEGSSGAGAASATKKGLIEVILGAEAMESRVGSFDDGDEEMGLEVEDMADWEVEAREELDNELWCGGLEWTYKKEGIKVGDDGDEVALWSCGRLGLTKWEPIFIKLDISWDVYSTLMETSVLFMRGTIV